MGGFGGAKSQGDCVEMANDFDYDSFAKNLSSDLIESLYKTKAGFKSVIRETGGRLYLARKAAFPPL